MEKFMAYQNTTQFETIQKNTFGELFMSENKEENNITPKNTAILIFNYMKSLGFKDKEIVAVSSEILDSLTTDIRNRLLESSH
jgi:hypothetical protein